MADISAVARNSSDANATTRSDEQRHAGSGMWRRGLRGGALGRRTTLMIVAVLGVLLRGGEGSACCQFINKVSFCGPDVNALAIAS